MPADKESFILHAIKSYGRNLFSFIRKRVKTEADAEDILQDVWFQLSSVVNAEPIEQTGAWLYRVARNKIIDKHKKKREELFEPADGGQDENEPDFREILFTDDTTPETEYLRNLFWEQLFLALEELPEEQRQVFVWHELEDVPFKEIAEMTGENTATLITRKRYAVLHLRKRLKQLYTEITHY
ncbi:RNA polymerase sigma factor [Hufsiella ginkgonis]|uniref:Sigma-70 family RNA polymerase sigma factor n=1 Tax=Hufsiella ginkgonis TaxID=2695274 RepID=A0A7K1XXF7_9SPHI|nr:RNA polymerase sigma factor [Hufsiella ginkgonis]MXV15694.1 sigma-70 family RNA polymerase sigma factor [Hufsiella ginkgonis]